MHYRFSYVGAYCPGDVHWAHLEASALGSLIAACPTWKRREEESGVIMALSCIVCEI